MANKVPKLQMTDEAKEMKLRRKLRRPKWRGKPEDKPGLSELQRRRAKMRARAKENFAKKPDADLSYAEAILAKSKLV
jgi:hypothetical protein